MELAQGDEKLNSPLWDVNFSLPIIETVVDFKLDNIIPGDARHGHSALLVEKRWPVATSVTLDCAASIPFTSELDIDDNGINDFIIDKIRAEEASLEVEFVVNVDGMPVDISADRIELESITVEGVTYSLAPVVEHGRVLKFRALNFPAAGEDGIFALNGSGGAASIEIDRLDITCLQAETAKYNGALSVLAVVTIGFGSSLAVIGDCFRPADLLDMTETIPLSGFPGNGISEFGIWVDSKNSFPFPVVMDSALSSTDGSTRYHLADYKGNRLITFPGEQDMRVYLLSDNLDKEDYALRLQLKLEPAAGIEIATSNSILVGVEVRGRTKLGLTM